MCGDIIGYLAPTLHFNFDPEHPCHNGHFILGEFAKDKMLESDTWTRNHVELFGQSVCDIARYKCTN